MNELDFSGKQVLVVGGSSGIGNGIAQAFRAKGARVAVCGTRAQASDYSAEDGSDLAGLSYAQLDVSDPQAVAAFKPSFDRLDVLVLAQGAVIYRRGEFQMDGFRKVMEVNLMSLMACATKFHEMLAAAKGSLIIVSSTAAYHSTMGNPAYNASKTGAMGLTRTLGEAWAEDGIRVNGIAPGLVDTNRPRRHQDDQGDDGKSEAAGRRARAHSVAAARHARRHGRRRVVPRFAARLLHRRPDHHRRRRADPLAEEQAQGSQVSSPIDAGSFHNGQGSDFWDGERVRGQG
ncbi:SDR family NAD(P)-dependent oxidoreductase [Bradyrhizobium ivorense]|uniref:SDR family NAD(P)-dependent oxidoreductase n=1 Tax=Bradyrhizobium ivorense TaxID=2511166 RepID=UPI003FD82F1B